MVKFKAFEAVRPKEGMAREIASPPYDVFTEEEARKEVQKNPKSFLKVVLPEAFSKEKPYDFGRRTYEKMKEEGLLIRDPDPAYYIYQELDGEKSQTGLVGLASVDDYLEKKIKVHEKTRKKKEEGRVDHLEALEAHTGPVFLFAKGGDLKELMAEGMKNPPLYDFTSDDGVSHRVWKVSDEEKIREIKTFFQGEDSLYIGDGHHRAAAAVALAKKRRETDKNPNAAFNFFLSIVYPEEDLEVLPYNRLVRVGEDFSIDKFFQGLAHDFDLSEEGEAYRPEKKGDFGLYYKKTRYKLSIKKEREGGVVENLDVSLLQDLVLAPLLGIKNPREDPRLSFIGGKTGREDLVREADRENSLAFLLYPTSLAEIEELADLGLDLPPKSTRFDPKPRSGLFIHEF